MNPDWNDKDMNMQTSHWTATLVQLLSLADWWRTGRHEEFGVVSIKQQVSYFASHELTHLPQIERPVRQERR